MSWFKFVLFFLLAMPSVALAQTEGDEEASTETPVADADSTDTAVADDADNSDDEEADTISSTGGNDGDNSEDEERIVVTGSRIPRSNLTTSVPVTVIDREFLQNSGEVFLGDILSQIPQLSPSGAQVNDGGNTTGVGTVDLRGFGSGRTLTLVNGRRHIGGVGLATIVDTNTIPQALIERVEILTGGASAAYGSDAIAGVTNFILMDDFDGFTTTAQYGVSERGDNQTWSIASTIGTNFDQDRGNAVLSLEYTRRQGIDNSQRRFSNTDYFSLLNPNDMDTPDIDDGIPDEILTANAGFNFITPSGIVLPFSLNQSTFNADGSIRPSDFGQSDPVFATTNGEQVGGDFIRLAGRGPLIPAQERIMATSLFSYEFADWAKFYGEAKLVFTDNSGSSTGQPSFDNGGGELIINRDNAFLPTGLGALMDRMGLTTIEMRRFNDDFGPRTQDVTRLTLRAAVGLKGEVNENVYYDVGATWGRAELSTADTGNRINDRYFAATDAVVDVNGEVNGNPGEIVCRVSLQQVRGEQLTLPNGDAAAAFAPDNCTPTSIFGPGALNPNISDNAFATTGNVSSLEQLQLMGFVTLNSTNYLELPGGPISLVLGSEYRRDESVSRADLGEGLDLAFTPANVSSRGIIDVGEVFGELNLPLLAGIPGVEELSVQAGGRLSRYNLDQVGTVYTLTASGAYRPTIDVTLRGSFSRAVRSPNVDEAFAAQQTAFTNVADPCDDQLINDAGPERVANCVALAERFGFEGFAPGVTSIPFEGSRTTVEGGNSDLETEKARNWTAGGVLSPRWVPNLVVNADYYNFVLEDQIATIPVANIVQNCVDFDSIDNQFCELFVRSPETFEIEDIRLFPLNLASLETQGIDIQLSYLFDVEAVADLLGIDSTGELGSVVLNGNANHVIRFRRFPNQDDLEEEDVLEGFNGFPQWRINGTATYRRDKLAFTYRLNWIDGFSRRGRRELLQENPDGISPQNVRPKIYHNIRLGYQVLDQVQAYAGVNNLLDQEPPVGFIGDNGFNDVIGRFYYFGTQIDY